MLTHQDQLKKDQETLDEPDFPQPDPPDQPDDTSIREKVKVKAMEIRRRPGEPKLLLEMSNTTTITPNASCPT